MSRQGATAVEIAPPAPVEVAPPAAAMSAYGARAPSDIWLLTRIRIFRYLAPHPHTHAAPVPQQSHPSAIACFAIACRGVHDVTPGPG